MMGLKCTRKYHRTRLLYFYDAKRSIEMDLFGLNIYCVVIKTIIATSSNLSNYLILLVL